jgi:hypothetical protein
MMPDMAQTYALPQDVRDTGMRHWSYHEISYDYIRNPDRGKSHGNNRLPPKVWLRRLSILLSMTPITPLALTAGGLSRGSRVDVTQDSEEPQHPEKKQNYAKQPPKECVAWLSFPKRVS